MSEENQRHIVILSWLRLIASDANTEDPQWTLEEPLSPSQALSNKLEYATPK